MTEKITDILSKEHIQDVGRELWQSHYDNDSLDTLSESVIDIITDELLDEIDPRKRPIKSLVEAFVEEHLDVSELNQEAEDNTEYIREIQEASRGQY